jgi:alpha-L-fucosidase
MNIGTFHRSRTLLVAALTITLLLFVCSAVHSLAQPSPVTGTNRADRLEWFRDQGFGLFIHWSVDSQLGVVISHSLVGASDDYTRRFFNELPRTFNPHKFNAPDLAVLAKFAGIRYVVFTAKHHSGFCMWDTATTDFNVLRTPFKRDITAEILSAFRAQGIAPGLYFSPDDFWWLHQNGRDIQRRIPEVQPTNNPGLMAYDLAQVRELFTKYGNVDVVFFDGQAEKLRDLAWQLQPDTIVTRGAIQTPEKTIPGKVLEGAWEACLTMGDGWQYQSMLENYKSSEELIGMLIEIRAKGGNLLLNVGPKPDGELPIEQEERLREIALWMFVNGEAIYGVRPWAVPNEKNIWFTKQKDTNTVYTFITHKDFWKLGEARDFVLTSVRATEQTEISVLGQNDRVLEYQPTVPKTTWKQEADGLHVHVTHAQRLRDYRQWLHPVVLKITYAAVAASQQPVVEIVRWGMVTGAIKLEGNLSSLGSVSEVEAGFEYRDITGQDTSERTSKWQQTKLTRATTTGAFSADVTGLKTGNACEFRAVAMSGTQTVYGREMELKVQ